MYSMTGFGKAELKDKTGKFSVELTSVNNRFLEVSVRLPRAFFSLESKIKKLISSVVSRGKIKVFINYEETDDSPDKYLINEAAFKAYYNQLTKLKKKYKLDGKVLINDLLLFPDISSNEKESIDEKVIWPPLQKVFIKALDQLVKMRKKEGGNMKKDMIIRLNILKKSLLKIENLSNNSIEIRKEKLTKRLDSLLDSTQFDRSRLEEEIAVFAERVDISEECTRLKSHFVQYESFFKLKEPVGKQLNFVLQEMNRETNTIASKSYHVDISAIIISMKTEIEKIRELVQNVE